MRANRSESLKVDRLSIAASFSSWAGLTTREGFSQIIWLKPLFLINLKPLAEASGNSFKDLRFQICNLRFDIPIIIESL
jgi:hypothetical protein